MYQDEMVQDSLTVFIHRKYSRVNINMIKCLRDTSK